VFTGKDFFLMVYGKSYLFPVSANFAILSSSLTEIVGVMRGKSGPGPTPLHLFSPSRGPIVQLVVARTDAHSAYVFESFSQKKN
jgi:hypothetical protein